MNEMDTIVVLISIIEEYQNLANDLIEDNRTNRPMGDEVYRDAIDHITRIDLKIQRLKLKLGIEE
jgi:hypothetical protein